MVAAAIVYVALRIRSMWAPYLWGDEVFNYFHSHLPWTGLLKGVAFDMAHPPFFYLILKPWIWVAGSSMPGLRMFTVAFSVAAIFPLLALGKELSLRRREMALALFLMAVNNYLILYSYYLRPYSLLFLLTVCSDLVFVRFLRDRETNSKRAIIALAVVNTLFVYTHYFAWLVLMAQYVWIFVKERRRLRQFTVAMLVCVLVSLPWAAVIMYASTRVSYTFWDQMSWSHPPGLQNVELLLRSFNGGFDSMLLTLGGSAICLMILLLPSVSRQTVSGESEAVAADGNPILLLLWLTIFPIVSSLIAARVFTWIWEPRYVIVSIVPYILLLSARAWRLKTPALSVAAVVFLVVWSAAAGITDDLPEKLHGPNVSSYWLVRGLSRAEAGTSGTVRVYASPYAEQGLRLALDLTGQRRFRPVSYPAEPPPADAHFWIAFAEHDPLASRMMKRFSSDTAFVLGDSIYSGVRQRRQILISVRRR